MSRRKPDPLAEVRALYERSLQEHGTTSKGVGWKDDSSHDLRLAKLSELIDVREPVTINDLGCGYGAFFPFLKEKGVDVREFRGYDISALMVEEAQRRYPGGTWIEGSRLDAPADYSFACGIFNVRMQAEESGWMDHIESTLDNLNAQSRRGFAFNLLSTYVDFKAPNLYYGDPGYYFDLCKRRFSRRVALLHDYPLFEWTILVRKAEAV